jgi:cobalt transporter subunit CbtA
MFKRLFAGALFAGLGAGALAALIELTFVVPLIHEGEMYETGALIHFGAAGSQEHVHEEADAAAPATAGAVALTDVAPVAEAEADHDHSGHDHGGAPENPLTRAISTTGFFMVSYTGFALLLLAGFALAERAGHSVNARSGVIWGLCGFFALQLAPAFGLPPELPGGSGAALEARQVWWAACVASTAGGLALLAFGRNALALGAGAVLLAAPHLIGAPTAAFAGVAPPELSAHFTARVLGAGAVCWALLGTIAGAIWSPKA